MFLRKDEIFLRRAAERKPTRRMNMQERHYLTPLFEPKSVAIIGASESPGSIGAVLVRNMIDAGYKGKLFAVNPKHDKIFDIPSYASVEDIPQRLDLAVIATRPPTVPGIVEACGRAGVRSAIVISAGFSETGSTGRGPGTRGAGKRAPSSYPPHRSQLSRCASAPTWGSTPRSPMAAPTPGRLA